MGTGFVASDTTRTNRCTRAGKLSLPFRRSLGLAGPVILDVIPKEPHGKADRQTWKRIRCYGVAERKRNLHHRKFHYHGLCHSTTSNSNTDLLAKPIRARPCTSTTVTPLWCSAWIAGSRSFPLDRDNGSTKPDRNTSSPTHTRLDLGDDLLSLLSEANSLCMTCQEFKRIAWLSFDDETFASPVASAFDTTEENIAALWTTGIGEYQRCFVSTFSAVNAKRLRTVGVKLTPSSVSTVACRFDRCKYLPLHSVRASH